MRIQSATINTTHLGVMLTAYFLLYTNVAAGQQQPPVESNTAEASIDLPPASPAECSIDPTIKRWIRFRNLVSTWRNERGSMSSITEMSMLPSYQKIIGMGVDAIPLILKELKSEGDDPDQWFWALLSISEANDLIPPQIKVEDQGNFRKMAQAWLEWADNQGYAG
jgi:hypothetical protein